jgi:hypothetical protein
MSLLHPPNPSGSRDADGQMPPIHKGYFRVCKKHGLAPHVWEARKERKNPRWRCVRCRASKSQERNVHQRKRLLLDYFGGAYCRVCGYNYDIRCLQFHHVDPTTKLFGIAEGLQLSTQKLPFDEILKEAAKCLIVDGRCHNEIEFGLRQPVYVFQPQGGYDVMPGTADYVGNDHAKISIVETYPDFGDDDDGPILLPSIKRDTA